MVDIWPKSSSSFLLLKDIKIAFEVCSWASEKMEEYGWGIKNK